ncbi:aldo/keto reductase [Salisediminibacterium halotolerans]|uniref:aldo/keto reductase n=1 Tax=Salisediminibacterium halotolerans TaxID=517425 RepID=UPI000EAD9839|nr:aldo/keto reductase [Salisediminibacterium halotolerans]RLJ73187.1 D-threo-aldose 1-dehydrogenase [Actinophytocola xinjiangensis]RPE86609.1 D-threo-aldose 1-dehydrogenase [Salisediminibacterium halotolerans]TWG33984.1 D-threo-aldose 1-dehydrogenase [Salisediminibacterium halotolerans]GEL06609.1 D-threo-aldose 1-dehydrogenase [Salisediminibacterium halotolerans]
MNDLKQTGKLGFGTAPLGNMFRDIPEDEARATVAEAWKNGIRYFDTAPLYGAGLAEIRLGDALSDYPRDEFVLSTKVGRVIENETEEKQGLFADGRKNKVTDDYTAEGTLRSIEQSLERLQTDRLDYVYVHDISQDFQGDEWIAKFEEARTGAFHELTRLKEEGVITDWGIGVNTTEPIEIALDLAEASPGINLQATRYTLLDHEHALQRLMPKAEEQGSGIVIGAPYGSGIIAGGSHYKYKDASSEVTSQVEQLNQIAERHNVSLIAAALQFSAAHPAVTAVIPGTTRPERIKQNNEALQANIPAAFWHELLDQKLISDKAPLPSTK